MSKLLQPKTVLTLTMAIVPVILWAQATDVFVTVTAECFSICLDGVNSKGVQGNVTVTSTFAQQTATKTVDVKVQCNGVDVPGATQSLGSVSVGPLSSITVPYSIAFTASAGCAYTVVATASAAGEPDLTGVAPFTADCADQPCGVEGCTLTQGYWKNHPDEWPVDSLTLGTTTYTKTELLSILKQPVKGNGLVSLAHQLIAAKLNVANGATCASISGVIADADSMINGLVVPPVGSGSLSTSAVSSLVSQLDQFNNGLTSGCPGHCAE